MPVRVLLLLLLLIPVIIVTGIAIAAFAIMTITRYGFLLCQTYCQDPLSLAPPRSDESGNLYVGNLFPILLAISTLIWNYSDDFSL